LIWDFGIWISDLLKDLDFGINYWRFHLMDKTELKRRTKAFAVDVIKFTESLPNSRALSVLSNQLIRSSSSVGANYRSACRGKSQADFINKIIIVEEEADESHYWLELIEEVAPFHLDTLPILKKEAFELTAIFTAIGKTAKFNQRQSIELKNQQKKINKSEIETPNSEME
jgi:four helix bundle protein